MNFARLFKFRVLPGREQAYADYLRDVVTSIDEAAHANGVFERLHTLVPETEVDWNHGRLFVFRDLVQRDLFAAEMAKHAASFDGNPEATAARKAFAETLRVLVTVLDLKIT